MTTTPHKTYQVIARKWRPQSFHDLVGQEHVAKTLLNALRNERLPHALLFTGVRGTGKTSSARILAKSLRCANAVDFVPCNRCGECEDIANSRSLDVIEIDGASNNGVDAIRELRETVGYMPSHGKQKVYIIDEVHMLSTSAFNALLKTLEEPPPHVVFIMATTEVQKIPSTILSRCQRFDFRRIPSRQIAEQLKKICSAENVAAEVEALWLIAREADGSMRDSQSLLDQVITFSEGSVTLKCTVDVLGLTDRNILLETLTALLERDSAKTLAVIEKIFSAGYDARVFAQDLLETIRNALFVRLLDRAQAGVVDLPESEIKFLAELTQPLSKEDLHLLFDMCLKGVSDLGRAQDSRIVLEMLLLRMSAAPNISRLSELAHGVSKSASAAAPPAVKVSEPTVRLAVETAVPSDNGDGKKYSLSSFVRAASPEAASRLAAAEEAKKRQQADSEKPTANSTPVASPSSVSETDSEQETPSEEHKDPWHRFVERVKKSNSLLGAMLENTHLIEQSQERLTIGVPKKMSFMLDKVKDPDNLKRIEAFLETFWQQKLNVEVKLADIINETVTPRARNEERLSQAARSIESAIEQSPLVKTAKNVFKTQIKSIKDSSKSKRETT